MRLSGKRALVTCADQYMGPAIVHAFREEGADIVACGNPLTDQKSVDELMERAGEIDVLVANFAEPPRTSPVETIEDKDWLILFDKLVHPLMRMIRAVVPQMKIRNAGKIIAVTSAGPLRGIPNTTAYCAARGAQNAFIRSVGLELAKFNIQVNAIAQNYVRNNTYYPDEMLETERFQQHLKQFVPTKKVAEGFETAELALYLASERCTHMVGQIIPLAGGWTTTC
jgi:2-keto-3-deoxy-L-fuconate dehydrogenase